MNQSEFETALKELLTHSLSTAKFSEVKLVAEALLYSELLPNTVATLNTLEKRRLVFLLEKFRRYSCSTVSRRQQLRSFSNSLAVQSTPSRSNQLIDPLARKVGLSEDLNHLKPQLLTLQTRHYHLSNS
jgi:hypothetical protein